MEEVHRRIGGLEKESLLHCFF
ncbi:protein of unknown function [Candidatus Nitrosacidococcus tergens]|uniref:Uncharacterized protein n=1 Tax=Candidatus Nitrosacidococcus tergens TaxID=553981 RepID=A0A7G1Q9L8_9GAMM|nr:protein of unknown function [Candidatus Nitrosacidococcus tergens]